MIKKIIVKNAVKEANLIRRSNRIPQKSEIVEKIISDVIKFGDSAILKYTKKYDKVKIDSITVDKAELKKAYKEVTANQLNSLKESKKLLENLESLTSAVKAAKPEGLKKELIKSIYLSSTMGPSVKVDPNTIS